MQAWKGYGGAAAHEHGEAVEERWRVRKCGVVTSGSEVSAGSSLATRKHPPPPFSSKQGLEPMGG